MSFARELSRRALSIRLETAPAEAASASTERASSGDAPSAIALLKALVAGASASTRPVPFAGRRSKSSAMGRARRLAAEARPT